MQVRKIEVVRWMTPVVAVGLATGVREVLDPWLGNRIPFGLYFLAVAVTAQIKGYAPALFATVLSALAVVYFFIPPRFTLIVAGEEDVLALLLFVLVCLAIVRLGYLVQRGVERLYQNEARLRAIFDEAGVGILEINLDDRLIAVNDHACKILGYPRNELLGTSIHDLTAPEDRERSDLLNSELHSGMRDRLDYEKRYLKRDGSALWVHVTVSVVHDPRGNWIRSIATVEDISERKSGEEQLRLQGAGLIAAANGIVVTDTTGRIVWVNPAFTRLTGYTAEEALGQNASFLKSDRHDSPFYRTLWETVLSGAVWRGEMVNRRKDGTLYTEEMTITPVREAGGGITHFIAIKEDITERKRAEESLRHSESQLKKAQEISHVGSWELDLIKNVLVWSEEVYRIFGVEPGRFGATYEAFLEHVHPDDREAVDTAYTGSLRENQDSYEIEHRVIRKFTGDVRFVHEKCEHIRDASGRIVRSVGMVHDITERRRAEDALREADRRKDEFLAMLAHELRNPLSTISAGAALLARNGPREQTQVVEALRRQTKNLAKLVDDLLDISRIIRGRVTIEKEPLDLRNAVRRAIETARPEIDKGKHRLVVSLPDETVPMYGDALRLEQIVGNLLLNAARYSEQGGVISLSVEPSRNSAIIKVEDKGDGIPPDLQERIFEPFAQINPGLHRSKGGLGIGLTIVKRLTELHGGYVKVYSEGIKKGSTFTVCLPMEKREAKCQRDSAIQAMPGLEVVIVEDNRDTADLTSAFLKGAGHHPAVAYDGDSGLRLALESVPDVVLLDIGLPGVDGYEIARQIRSAAHGSLIIGISGYGQEGDRRASREAGFDHHLLKPLDFDSLNPIFAEWQGSTRFKQVRNLREQMQRAAARKSRNPS